MIAHVWGHHLGDWTLRVEVRLGEARLRRPVRGGLCGLIKIRNSRGVMGRKTVPRCPARARSAGLAFAAAMFLDCG